MNAPLNALAAQTIELEETNRAKMHPAVTETADYVRSLKTMIGAHPSVLYAQAVLRPSLALAQGHALSLIQGLDVQVCELNVEPTMTSFDMGLRALLSSIKEHAEGEGLVCSLEIGHTLTKGKSTVGTVRVCVRDDKRVLYVMLYSGRTILTHSFEGSKAIDEMVVVFGTLYEPRDKGYISHVNFAEGKVGATRYENHDDGVILNEAYPFVDNMREYVGRYLESQSAVLSLFGIGGTGKSTLMRKISTLATNRHVLLVDNPILYRDPALSSSLMSYIRQLCAEGERPLVLFEEVDEYIQSKKDGNDFLVQLLSMSSGVLPLDIKVVLASNLKNTDTMLDVLQRGGRSFGSVEFVKMNATQAKACRKVMGLPEVEITEDCTLAEAICEKVNNIGTNRNRTGFMA